MIEAEGSEPCNGNPGYAVLIAQSPLIDEQHREVPLGRALSVKPSLTPVSQL